MMQMVVAVLRPEKLDDVRQALDDLGIHGLTVSDASGYGRQRGHKEVYRGASYAVDLIPKLRIEVVTPEDRTDDVVEAIIEAAKTGSIGDGKIWVLPVSDAVRVRTGERGLDAL